MDGYGQLSERSPVRIAAGEELATLHEFRDLIERGKVHVLQPDVSRCGGVTETMRIAAFAQAHQRPIVPHHYSSGILGAVSVHINASIPNMLFQEWPAPGEGSELNTSLVEPVIPIDRDGLIVLPTGPGLGVELNQEIFTRYRVV
jgi:L-alanine-DL-glutamate epimerase-like enolase superfamily enzyme